MKRRQSYEERVAMIEDHETVGRQLCPKTLDDMCGSTAISPQ